MSVFICWSGDRSYELANAVAMLLSHSIKGLKESDVFVSDKIEKGLNWFDTILDRLEGARAGIVCLTAENINGAWLHFEAGALARRLATGAGSGKPQATRGLDPPRHRLFPLLHRINASEVRGPLGSFQGTSTTRSDMSQMVRSVAASLRLGLKDSRLSIPDRAWGPFEAVVENLAVPVRSLVTDFDRLFQRKTFNEPLQKCTDQAWVRRYDGARVTHDALHRELERVRRACAPHEREVFQLLLAEVDGYAMSIQALLVSAPAMTLTKQGDLNVDPRVLRCCEDRRLAVKSLVARLLEPEDQPLLEDAAAFVGADTPEERKLIVHRLEERIRQHRESAYEPAPGVTRQAVSPHTAIERILEGVLPKSLRASSWELDRIYYYLLIQYFGTLALRWERGRRGRPRAQGKPVSHECLCAVRDVEMEVERFRAKAKGGSLMPLSYSLAALEAIEPRRCADKKQVPQALRAAIELVHAELTEVSPGEAEPILRMLKSLGWSTATGSSSAQGRPRTYGRTSVSRRQSRRRSATGRAARAKIAR